MAPVEALRRGRESYRQRAWMDAHTSLSRADRAAPLGAEDVELLATSAYMLGRDDEWMSLLERAHQMYLDTGETLRAVRCAFWVGMNLALRGEMGPASGWLGRAQRLLEGQDADCAERGYLLLPVMFRHEAMGDLEAAAATAAEAAGVGERLGDRDLFALAVHEQGLILVRQGQVREGLGLLDEAMVAVTAGELSPIPTGIVYCGVIAGCQGVYELRRAQEWTAALTRWCDEQPDLIAFTGACLVHRAEITQLGGAWRDALDQARLAAVRLSQVMNQAAAAQAFYRQGEVHRLLGEFAEAEEAYREASRMGWEPQPGLALLRLAQGGDAAAVAAIRRATGEAAERWKRANLLPAYVEIMLAVGEIAEARAACGELEDIGSGSESRMLRAVAGHARGAVELAGGDFRAALVSLRRASQLWHELGVPYEAARTRVLLALACRAAGDDDARSARAGRGARRLRAAGRGAGSRQGRCAGAAGRARRRLRADAARVGGAAPGGRRQEQQGDRLDPGHQRAHRRPACPEHPGEAPGLVANRRGRVRVPARPRLTARMVRNDHGATCLELVDPGDAGEPLRPYRRALTQWR